MRSELAHRRIAAFERRFGEAHLYLACHAAVPLALTPDLLYRLWVNFQRDIQHVNLAIPWVAVADVLLSGLCREVGHELYEMEESIRKALLARLKSNERFGEQRVHDIAEFLLVYVQRQLNSKDPDTRDFANVQRWVALSYIPDKHKEAVNDLTIALSQLQQSNRAELIRFTSLVETIGVPSPDFEPLLVSTRNMVNRIRKTPAETYQERLLKRLRHIEPHLQIEDLQRLATALYACPATSSMINLADFDELEALIEEVRFFEEHSEPMQRLDNLLEEIRPQTVKRPHVATLQQLLKGISLPDQDLRSFYYSSAPYGSNWEFPAGRDPGDTLQRITRQLATAPIQQSTHRQPLLEFVRHFVTKVDLPFIHHIRRQLLQWANGQARALGLPEVEPPPWIIDRERELHTFETLLTFDTPERVLLIQDRAGAGKSRLLHHFAWVCTHYHPPIPTSLVDLRETRITSPILLIRAIARDFISDFDIKLSRYSTVDQRSVYSHEGRRESSKSSSLINEPHPEPELVDDVSINALFEDLKEYCSEHPAVIMIDSFEQGNAPLQEWVADRLLKYQVLEQTGQPSRLLLVVAGQQVPTVEHFASLLTYRRVIRRISPLSEWKSEHVAQCLQNLGLPSSSADTDFYYQQMVKGQLTPFDMILLMETVRRMTIPTS